MKLVDEPYQGKQKDEDGVIRDVWIFPLKVIDDQAANLVDETIIKDNYEQKEKQAKRLSNDELHKKALESQSSKTSIRKRRQKPMNVMHMLVNMQSEELTGFVSYVRNLPHLIIRRVSLTLKRII